MQSDGIGWGILGTGAIASLFASDLPVSRTGRLVAVGSRREETAHDFGVAHGAQRFYGDYASVLRDNAVDAVYIATPHSAHAEWAIKALQAGKHVLCEKPLTVNHATAVAVIEAAREHDVFCMEAYMYRCHPQTHELAKLIRSGVIGEVRQMHASYAFHAPFDLQRRTLNHELAGGGILDVGGYPVSLARLVAGAAVGETFADPDELTACGHVGEQSRVDEWAIATLTFPHEIVAQVATGVRLAADNAVRIYGSEGYLVVPSPWTPGRDGKPTTIEIHRVGKDVEFVRFEPARLYALEADTVAEHLNARQAPAMSWADTLGQMETLDRWRAAIRLTYDIERYDAPQALGQKATSE